MERFIIPSLARGIFEAIFWKPPVQCQIVKIEVLRSFERMTICRNEVSEIILPTATALAMSGSDVKLGPYIEEKRQQRSSLILKNVTYRLHAHMCG